jgi:deoxyribose-phosphate aldolase
MKDSYYDLAKMIDHSLLRPELTIQDVETGCRLARSYETAVAMVRPCDLSIACEILDGSDVLPATVVGFPHGDVTTQSKVAEAACAIEAGARELDMVLNIGRLLSGDLQYVRSDIRAVTDEAHASNVRIKVIFENCFLTDDLKKTACEICTEVGVDWVKTSTGFGPGGATIPDLQLMLAHVGPGIQVKAAGGIRDLAKALEVKQLGCTRFGATATAAILDAWKQQMHA